MAQMSISLPDKLKKWAEARVSEGSYPSTSDHVRDLMRRDRARADEIAWLQAELDKGWASPTLDQDAFEVIDELLGAVRPASEAA